MRKPKTPPLTAPPTRTRSHLGKEFTVSEAHPVADCYQWMTADQLDGLAESIRKDGQKDPIRRLPDGRIVDGRNRELACRVADVEPRYEECDLTGLSEIIAHVRVANDYRRHSTESQRAMIAARLGNLKRGTNQHASRVDGSQEPSTSLDELARAFRVSFALIKRAKSVIRRGTATLAAVVDAGGLDVTNAARVARLDASVQDAIATAPDPKGAIRRARMQDLRPPLAKPGYPLVADGEVFIRITPETRTVGAVCIDAENELPGIPRPLADGRVWCGWYLDIRCGIRTVYLVPTPHGGWFVVLFNSLPDEWLTNTRPFCACSTMAHLRHWYDFDVYRANWQPSRRFAPSAINPLYLDPDYAPTLSDDFKARVEFEKSLEESRQARQAREARELDDEIPF